MVKTMKIDELIENFSLLEDWEDRYGYLIELGKKLPELPADKRTEQTLVQGCMSQVWLIVNVDEKECLDIQADSDAIIVRGLIAILLIIYNGLPAKDVVNIDIDDIFTQLDLHQHISPNRRNGFYAMVERIQLLKKTG